MPLREVSLFTAEGNYVRLLWGKERPLLGRSLTALEEKLDPKRFFRANRSQIVNLDFIQQVEAGRRRPAARAAAGRAGDRGVPPAGATVPRPHDGDLIPQNLTLTPRLNERP